MNNVKNSIGWADWSINPVKGLCPVGCSYCYARRLYKRFKWNPEIRYDNNSWLSLDDIKKPSKIFIGSTIELFGDWISESWMRNIMAIPNLYPQHTFIFLTKQPQNLIKWSPFPDNCWVGVTVTTDNAMIPACHGLEDIVANVKFISFEPLLGEIDINCIRAAQFYRWLDRVIIGTQTPYSPKTAPHIEWVSEIVEAADKANIPVFLKNNLEKVIPQEGIYSKQLRRPDGTLRQEFPERK